MRRGEAFLDETTLDNACRWHSRFPAFVASAVLLDGPFFMEEVPEQPPQYGICVDAQTALRL